MEPVAEKRFVVDKIKTAQPLWRREEKGVEKMSRKNRLKRWKLKLFVIIFQLNPQRFDFHRNKAIRLGQNLKSSEIIQQDSVCR